MKKIIYSTILSIIFINACRTPIDLDIENIEEKIVLNSTFSPDSLLKVYLSRDYSTLIDYRSIEDLAINNAFVRLYKNNTLIDTLIFVEDGEYISDIYPEIGFEYTIIAEATNFPSVEASDIIPEIVPIDTVFYERIDEELYRFKINIRISDPPGNNYYILHFDDSYNMAIYKSDDPIIGNFDMNGNVPIFIFSDELCKSETYDITVYGNLWPSIPNDSLGKFFYNLHSVSENLYTYCKSLNAQTIIGGEDIFELYQSGVIEPTPIFSNVENGLGIFGGFSTSRDSIFIPDNEF